MLSGASIAIAALLLIIPGFITDLIGFLLLLPFTRKIIIKICFSKKYHSQQVKKDYIEGEVVDRDKDEL